VIASIEGTNMTALFIFTRKQRASALLLFFNAGVAFLMYLAAHKYLPSLTNDTKGLTEIFEILDIAIWVIEAVLLGLALWFWFENKEIKVCVTPTTLSYCDPTFTDVSWQVSVSDIVELRQVTDSRQDYTSNLIVLKNGEQKQLMYGNYRGFYRRAFFTALVSANPKIIVPESIYSYKIARPSWAKRIRKKIGLGE
jgi:hypothetical protein